MKKLSFLLFSLLLWSCSLAQRPDPLSQPEVERLVQTLAADQMEGRGTFTPGIERASAFIQEEFRKAGLQPLPGLPGFAQPFALHQLQPEKLTVRLNGKPVSSPHLLALPGQEQLRWNHKNSRPQVRVIGPEDNLGQIWGEARSASQDQLVLVHPKHQEFFARIKNRHEHPPSYSFEAADRKSLVLVLTEEMAPKSFDVEVRSRRHRHSLANVAGMIPGKRPEEIVLLSAHYDHLGITTAVDGDSIANGADDDASGTAAVIALAHHFGQQPQPERTLVFATFTAEEIGGYGSQYFSRQLKPEQVVAMFNIEMIGKPSRFGPNTAYITGFERSSFGPLLQQSLAGTPYAFHPDPYPEQNLFYRSDNVTLARLGVPAHTISSTQIDRDTYYHTVKDELATLDLPHLTSIVRAIALSARDIVSGQATPTRVEKEKVN
jgi:hypothetical protein